VHARLPGPACRGLSLGRRFVVRDSDRRNLIDLAMEGSMKCIKYLLFGFNLLFTVRVMGADSMSLRVGCNLRYDTIMDSS
jgi:hypothetical protein